MQFTDPTVFADLLNPLKQSINSTLDSAIRIQREEAAKLKSLHNLRGWNPVGVFGKVECLGNTYESIGLYEESLRCFREINDMYKQSLQDGELTFFPAIAPTSLSEGEDSLSVLSTSAKPYRDMILHNSASLWDLKKYLLARTLMLLSKMGCGLAVMRETLVWLAETRTMVRDQDLPPYCLAAFYISVALEIVHHCFRLFLSPSGVLTTALPTPTFAETVSAKQADLDRLPPSFHALSGEVLCMTLKQLENIGTRFEYLPMLEPFVARSDVAALAKTRETTGITRQELLKALENEEEFLAFHKRLAQRTVEALARGGRPRARREIDIGLGTLEMHKGHLEAAHGIFSRLLETQPEQSSRWPELERLLLRRQLECHSKLKKPRNRAWVASVVSLLRSTSSLPRQEADVDAVQNPRPNNSEHAWHDEANIFETLRAASREFEREIPVSGFAKFSIIPALRRASLLGEQDGVSLPAIVFSSLQSSVAVEDVRFCLAGGDTHREQFWLTSGPLVLHPGRNDVLVRSFSNAPGKYVVDVTQVRLGRVVFQYIFSKPIAGIQTAASTLSHSQSATVITVPRDGDALDVALEQPSLIALDQPRYSELIMHSRRSRVSKATIRMKHQVDDRPLMSFGAGELLTASHEITLEPTEDGLGLHLTNVSSWTDVIIRFPFDEPPPSDGSAIALLAEIDYITKEERNESPISPKRSYRKHLELSTALPLGVNVQDFFQLDSLMCKFSISAGGGSTLMVKEALLERDTVAIESEDAADAYAISGPCSTSLTVVTPRQPAAYVFKIERRESPKVQTSSPPPAAAGMRLSIVYRTLHEGAKQIMLSLLRAAIKNAKGTPLSTGLRTLLEDALIQLVEKHLNVPAFAMTGAIRFLFHGGSSGSIKAQQDKYWKRLISRHWGLERSAPEVRQMMNIVELVVKRAAACGPGDRSGSSLSEDSGLAQWRTLQIPVEVPQMDIVNCVTLSLSSDVGTPTKAPKTIDRIRSDTFIVGRPLRGELRILSTFRWSPKLWPQVTASPPSCCLTTPERSHPCSLLSPSSSLSRMSLGDSLSSVGGDFETDADSVFEDAVSKAGSDITERGAYAGKTGANSSQPQSKSNSKQFVGVKGSETDGRKVAQPSQRMTYEVQSDFTNWVVVGLKRSVWQLPLPQQDHPETKSVTFSVTLIPLRTGQLTMPNVAVWALGEEFTSLRPSLAHGGQSEYRAGGKIPTGAHGGPILPSSETYVSNAAQRVQVVEAGALVPLLGQPGGKNKHERGSQRGSVVEDAELDDELSPRFEDEEAEGNGPSSGEDESAEEIVLPGQTFWIPESVAKAVANIPPLHFGGSRPTTNSIPTAHQAQR